MTSSRLTGQRASRSDGAQIPVGTSTTDSATLVVVGDNHVSSLRDGQRRRLAAAHAPKVVPLAERLADYFGDRATAQEAVLLGTPRPYENLA
jgi:hypothetical protein